MTSFMFMLVDVPEPVWNTSIGNWSSHWPVATSAAASWIAAATSSGSTPSSRLTTADGALDRRQRADQRPLDPQPGDREVLDRPLRLGAPPGVGRHPHLPHRVVLDAELVSGHDPNLRCCFDDRPRLHRAPPPRPGRHARTACSPPTACRTRRGRRPHASSRSSPRCSRSSPARRSATSPTGCGPPTSQQLRRILDDPEASANDRFVALDLLKNANIAAGGVLPMCQDTGTAIVMGKRGELVLTGGDDERAHQPRHPADLRDVRAALLADGPAHDVGRAEHRHQPARPRSSSTPPPGDAYKLLFMAKGGGSANKSYLYQETKAVLNRSVDAARSSTRSCARSAPRPARRTTSPSSSAARRRSSR